MSHWGWPGHVGHWSRFVWTFWSRLVGRTGTNVPCSWPTTIGPGWWLEPGPKAPLYSRFMPPTGTNEVPIYTPSRKSRAHCSVFFWPRGRGLGGALAHLLCTQGVRWNARATLLKLSPLEARPPSSIFLKICLDLAVRHAPSPSSPPSITRADLITDTTVVNLLFLSSFRKEKYSYLYV